MSPPSTTAPVLPWKPRREGMGLERGEIHVISFALDLPASKMHHLARVLSSDEARRAEAFRSVRDRRRFVAGRARARVILGKYLQQEPTDLHFSYGSNGKPALLGTETMSFNMSGSGGLGLLAIRIGSALGVDTERVRRFPNALSVAERYFSREEREGLRPLRERQLDAAFFSLWTRKEAVVKCHGGGLASLTRSLSFAPAHSCPVEQIAVERRGRRVLQWVFALPDLVGNYVAALATETAPSRVRCLRWCGP